MINHTTKTPSLLWKWISADWRARAPWQDAVQAEKVFERPTALLLLAPGVAAADGAAFAEWGAARGIQVWRRRASTSSVRSCFRRSLI
ncbi:MAG: hypothetical protein H6841_01875 [Planctomycetes bacterium]|nr:hypothetical protein [Planctomycetota bacterium]